MPTIFVATHITICTRKKDNFMKCIKSGKTIKT